jgi:hypothetical protein
MVLVSWVVSRDDTNLWCDKLMVDLLRLFGINSGWMHGNLKVLRDSSTWWDIRPDFMTLLIGSFV